MYRLTDSTFLVGVVGFAQFAGTVGLAPWTGAAADHYDRRKLMIGTQVGSIVVTAVLALLAAADAATTGVVVGLALVLGVFSAFSTPAMLTLVPLLVPEHELRPAIALNAAVHNVARAVGPVLGALIVNRFGIATAFGLNSLSYLALIVALLVIHPREQPERPALRPKFRESLRLVRDDRQLVLLMVAIMVVGIVTDPTTTLTPELVSDVFRLDDAWVGVLIGAFGTGAVLAAFSAGRVRDPRRTLTASLTVLGAGMAAFALAPNMAVAVPALVVAGFGYLTSTTTTSAAIQLGVADNQRGRVMAIWSVAFVGVRPFASLVDGALAALFGPRAAGVVFALPALVLAGLLLARRQTGDG